MGLYRYIVLDSYPLGNSAVLPAPQGVIPNSSQLCRQWITDCENGGATFLVPAIAYYEEVRELELRKAFAQIVRLQEYSFE